jgi:hypothetical protein
MPDKAQAENTIAASDRSRSANVGDVPEAIRRRYFTDERGGPGLGFYVDATVARAAFRDQGSRLSVDRADPNAIRDMAEIAKHRGWVIITARGSADFRREAWLTGRSLGLEVRGYRPTERDLQELERRQARHERTDDRRVDAAARSQLRVVDAVVRARVQDAGGQRRIMDAARMRIADWLERGAHFEPLSAERTVAPERRRTAGRGR